MINSLESLKINNIKTYNKLLKYPDDLPDLKTKRPISNTRPDGIKNCFFEQRVRGELPLIY